MAESKLRDLSAQFTEDIFKLCDTIKGHSSVDNQLERSATSIGANIYKANYAHGKADFIAKLQISLKECYETEYRLEIFRLRKWYEEHGYTHTKTVKDDFFHLHADIWKRRCFHTQKFTHWQTPIYQNNRYC